MLQVTPFLHFAWSQHCNGCVFACMQHSGAFAGGICVSLQCIGLLSIWKLAVDFDGDGHVYQARDVSQRAQEVKEI